MIKTCEKCWETYDTEKESANEYFCSKCNKLNGGEENEI